MNWVKIPAEIFYTDDNALESIFLNGKEICQYRNNCISLLDCQEKLICWLDSPWQLKNDYNKNPKLRKSWFDAV